MTLFDIFAAVDFFSDTIYHAPAIAFSGSGSAVYGDEKPYAARIARKQRTVIGKTGAIAVSRAQVWIATPPGGVPAPVKFGDCIRLPDGVLPSGNTTSEIIAIESLPDESGALFTKVYL